MLPIQDKAGLGRKVNIAPGKIPEMYVQSSSARDGQTSCKVWLASCERRRCSNEAKMRNPLKFAGVHQTPVPISAVSGPKFAILWETSGGDIAV